MPSPSWDQDDIGKLPLWGSPLGGQWGCPDSERSWGRGPCGSEAPRPLTGHEGAFRQGRSAPEPSGAWGSRGMGSLRQHIPAATPHVQVKSRLRNPLRRSHVASLHAAVSAGDTQQHRDRLTALGKLQPRNWCGRRRGWPGPGPRAATRVPLSFHPPGRCPWGSRHFRRLSSALQNGPTGPAPHARSLPWTEQFQQQDYMSFMSGSQAWGTRHSSLSWSLKLSPNLCPPWTRLARRGRVSKCCHTDLRKDWD